MRRPDEAEETQKLKNYTKKVKPKKKTQKPRLNKEVTQTRRTLNKKHEETTSHEEGTNRKDHTQTETIKKAKPTNLDFPNPNHSAQTEPRQR